MNSYVGSDSRTTTRNDYVPAYGPVDTVLGLLLFYVVVERATPTVVTVLVETVGLWPSTVGFGLAAFLWFVVVVTVLDQVRRQLAALGVGHHGEVDRERRRLATLSETRALAYLALLVVGGLLAVWTFETGVKTAVVMIPAMAALDIGAFLTTGFLVMIVFFASFNVATYALDRLVIGGVRTMLADWRAV